MPGDRVGDYEIMELLGAGGMGRVYKVRSRLTDRVEALKVVSPHLQQNPDLVERFTREIKVHAGLEHPNIAAFRNAQQVGDHLVMVMEYVDGPTVEALLDRGPLSVPDAVNYGIQLLDALEHAHAQGITHRDIKPSNTMLTSRGVIKLMDFGIAKVALNHGLTKPGVAVGAPSYMSPEQIRGAEVDARSDVYQAGLWLYECVTGKRAFGCTSEFDTMNAQLREGPVSPCALNPLVPDALCSVISRALEKEPVNRYPSAASFREALRAVASTGDYRAHCSPVAPARDPEIAALRAGLTRLLWVNLAALGLSATLAIFAVAAAIWAVSAVK